MMNIGQFGKAAFAAVVAFVGALGTILVGTDIGFGDVTAGQWVFAAGAALAAAGGVWGLPYVPTNRSG